MHGDGDGDAMMLNMAKYGKASIKDGVVMILAESYHHHLVPRQEMALPKNSAL